MKSKTYNKMSDLTADLGLSPERGDIAEMKARLTVEIAKAVKKQELTHLEVSELSGVPRSAITGIINGSLQKVSIERLVRVLGVLGKKVELKIRKAA